MPGGGGEGRRNRPKAPGARRPERARDAHVLRRGTEAHYEDPAYYDHAYRSRRADVRFYADLAEAHGGPVLELGVGTGRVAFETARRGIDVIGVDRLRSMLDRAEARLRTLRPAAARKRVALVRGGIDSVRLGRRFPLVISPFNVFQHLYTRADVEAALATVRAHLRPRGRFVFDVLLPDAHFLSRSPTRLYRGRSVLRPSEGRRYHYAESFQYDPVRQIQVTNMFFQGTEDETDVLVTPLAHRQFFPAELEALLHYNGLTLVERFGDWDRGPLTGRSESQVLVCRHRPGFSEPDGRGAGGDGAAPGGNR